MISAAVVPGKEQKRCVGTRDLWSDANIAGSPNADR